MSVNGDRMARYSVTVLAVLGGLAVLGIIAVLLLILGGPWWGGREPPRTVQAAATGKSFTIDDGTRIAGTPFVRISVSTGSDERGSYSASSSDRRNIAVLDTSTGRSRRLLPDNSRRIVSAHYLPAAASGIEDASTGTVNGKRDPETFYLIEIERPDNDRRDVVIGRIAGGASKTVLPDVDGINSPWMIDAGHAAVIVRERGRLVYRRIDMVAQTAAPAVPIEIGR